MPLDEPLRFEPIALPKVWGDRALAGLAGCAPTDDEPVGEVWQMADRDGFVSVVAEGAFAGRSLRGLMLSEREALLGRSHASAEGGFPLLVKLLGATKPLSVQVHPDARIAARIGGGAEAKDECWYILSAEPGAEILLGLKPGVDATQFAASASGPAVVDLLQPFRVEAGQFIDVPAGTVHSIGAGITLIEIQQSSDTSFRLWDWNRSGQKGEARPVHVDLALKAIDYERRLEGPRSPQFEDGGSVNRRAALVDGEYFALDMLEINGPLTHDTRGLAWGYVILEGSGRLCVGDGDRKCRIERGQAWLVPAAVGEHYFDSADGELKVLRIEVKGAEVREDRLRVDSAQEGRV